MSLTEFAFIITTITSSCLLLQTSSLVLGRLGGNRGVSIIISPNTDDYYNEVSYQNAPKSNAGLDEEPEEEHSTRFFKRFPGQEIESRKELDITGLLHKINQTIENPNELDTSFEEVSRLVKRTSSDPGNVEAIANLFVKTLGKPLVKSCGANLVREKQKECKRLFPLSTSVTNKELLHHIYLRTAELLLKQPNGFIAEKLTDCCTRVCSSIAYWRFCDHFPGLTVSDNVEAA